MPTPPHDDPFALFDAWFYEASQAVETDPEAMTIATVSNGKPSLRVVLLKHWDPAGFVFYTNRMSQKGEQLSANPVAALNLFWRSLRGQIRIEGHVEYVGDELSDQYFATRPRMSQIGAWASLQSQPLADRDTFDARVDEVERQYKDVDVPRPPHWGGYRVVPTRLEFWTAGDYRFHDRWDYERDSPDAEWRIQRLYP